MHLVCFGHIGYWKLLEESENKLVLKTYHTFQKQCSLSQYHLVTDKGLSKLFIPTLKHTRRRWYKDVEISYAEPWQRNHWSAIENAYRKAPFFIYYDYKIKPLFEKEITSLLEFNFRVLETFLECLKLELSITQDGKSCNYHELICTELVPYPQVFDNQLGFISGASILDLLFNLGPETVDYLRLR